MVGYFYSFILRPVPAKGFLITAFYKAIKIYRLLALSLAASFA